MREQTRRARQEELKNHYDSVIEQKEEKERMKKERKVNRGVRQVHPRFAAEPNKYDLKKFYGDGSNRLSPRFGS